MKRLLKPTAVVIATLQTACAYSIHDVYVSGFEPVANRSLSKEITSHAEQRVILGFKTQTDYMDTAYNQLQAQCPQGDITGIVTEFQTAMGFFSWHNHVYMRGLCATAAKKQGSKS